MSGRRCDDCGRFCSRTFDVWQHHPEPAIDRSVCVECIDHHGGPLVARLGAAGAARVRAAQDAMHGDLP